MQESNLGILLSNFRNGVSTPSLKNYKTTLETGLKILALKKISIKLVSLAIEFNNRAKKSCPSKTAKFFIT